MTAAEVRAPASVLGWRGQGEAHMVRLDELWRRIAALHWLPAPGTPVVVQIGQARRSPLVVETAWSLIDFLGEHTGASVVVLDAAGDGAPGARVRDLAAEPELSLEAVFLPGALTVPRLWFEAGFLLTVAGAGPAAEARLACALDAQAEPLRALGNPPLGRALVAEAHRLAASDLVIGCGYARFGRPASECWWAVGTSDVAVDATVAAAAGLRRDQLPCLRGLVRDDWPTPELRGSLPALEGYVAGGLATRRAALHAGARALRHGAVHDATMLWRNLGRIPGFLRRRRAARGGA